jgi:hypothetical protein
MNRPSACWTRPSNGATHARLLRAPWSVLRTAARQPGVRTDRGARGAAESGVRGVTALDRLAAALADRYRVERELGAGGMATSIWRTISVTGIAIRPGVGGCAGRRHIGGAAPLRRRCFGNAHPRRGAGKRPCRRNAPDALRYVTSGPDLASATSSSSRTSGPAPEAPEPRGRLHQGRLSPPRAIAAATFRLNSARPARRIGEPPRPQVLLFVCHPHQLHQGRRFRARKPGPCGGAVGSLSPAGADIPRGRHAYTARVIEGAAFQGGLPTSPIP